MGLCGVSKKKVSPTHADGIEPAKEIAVSPSQFIIESVCKFGDIYDIGKKLGGGLIHSHNSFIRCLWRGFCLYPQTNRTVQSCKDTKKVRY